MKYLIFVLIFGFTTTLANAAKLCDTNAMCSGSTLEVKECMGEILDEEDTRLNDVYQRLIADIQGAGYSDPSAIEWNLRVSQRNWITYRDTYCDFRFSTAEGGTIGGLLLLDCKCTLTRDKADHLSDDLAH